MELESEEDEVMLSAYLLIYLMAPRSTNQVCIERRWPFG